MAWADCPSGRKEGDIDGDVCVAVGGDEVVEEGTAEALNSGSGACEPGLGIPEDFAIAAWVGKGGRDARGYRGGKSEEMGQAMSGAPVTR